MNFTCTGGLTVFLALNEIFSPDSVLNFTGTFLETFRLALNSTLCFLTIFNFPRASLFPKMSWRDADFRFAITLPT